MSRLLTLSIVVVVVVVVIAVIIMLLLQGCSGMYAKEWLNVVPLFPVVPSSWKYEYSMSSMPSVFFLLLLYVFFLL